MHDGVREPRKERLRISLLYTSTKEKRPPSDVEMESCLLPGETRQTRGQTVSSAWSFRVSSSSWRTWHFSFVLLVIVCVLLCVCISFIVNDKKMRDLPYFNSKAPAPRNLVKGHPDFCEQHGQSVILKNYISFITIKCLYSWKFCCYEQRKILTAYHFHESVVCTLNIYRKQ